VLVQWCPTGVQIKILGSVFSVCTENWKEIQIPKLKYGKLIYSSNQTKVKNRK
jgi:hypothetical protein